MLSVAGLSGGTTGSSAIGAIAGAGDSMIGAGATMTGSAGAGATVVWDSVAGATLAVVAMAFDVAGAIVFGVAAARLALGAPAPVWHPSILQEESSCDTSDQLGPTPSLGV